MIMYLFLSYMSIIHFIGSRLLGSIICFIFIMRDFERNVCSCYRNEPRGASVYWPPYCLLLHSKFRLLTQSLPCQTQILTYPTAFNVAQISIFSAIYSLSPLHTLQNCTQHLLATGQINHVAIKDPKLLLPF